MNEIQGLHTNYFYNLIELAGIPLKRGWRTKLADHLGIKKDTMYSWVKRGIPEDGIALIEKRGYPRQKWLITDDYHQEPERIGMPADQTNRDSNRGSYGHPDLSKFNVTQLYLPERGGPIPEEIQQKLHDMLDRILSYGNRTTIAAIAANLEQFDQSIGHEIKIRELEERIHALAVEMEAGKQPGPPHKKKNRL